MPFPARMAEARQRDVRIGKLPERLGDDDHAAARNDVGCRIESGELGIDGFMNRFLNDYMPFASIRAEER